MMQPIEFRAPQIFRFLCPKGLRKQSSRLIYPHLARVCNAVTFFKSKVFHFSSMFLRLFLRFLSVILQPSDGGNVTSSTLRFQPKVSDMGKVLRCRAENPVMPASQIEDTWNLDINCEQNHHLPSFPTFLIQLSQFMSRLFLIDVLFNTCIFDLLTAIWP